MFENPRRGRQARNFTTNVPKILDLKSSSEQIFFRKLSLGAPDLIGDRHWPYCSCYPSSFVELCRIGSVCCWGCGYWRRVNRCCGGSGCWGSLTEELFLADWSSCFKLAMSFLASTSLFSSVFMASHFVRTRLASSSASFTASSYSFSFSSNCCPRSFVSFSWFRKACASLLWSSVSCHTGSGFRNKQYISSFFETLRLVRQEALNIFCSK